MNVHKYGFSVSFITCLPIVLFVLVVSHKTITFHLFALQENKYSVINKNEWYLLILKVKYKD